MQIYSDEPYADNVAVNVSTLDSNDVLVTGPNGYSQLATFLSVDNSSNGTPRTATYQITAPGGTWDSTDNGTYNLTVQSSQVADTSGNYVAASTFGSFNVTYRCDTTPPTVSAYSAPSVTTGGGTTETFTVTYADNVAVNVSTLDSNDVLVTGPNSYSQLATFVSVDNSSNGTPRTATYRLPAPGGTWDRRTTDVQPDRPDRPGGRHRRELRGGGHLRVVHGERRHGRPR